MTSTLSRRREFLSAAGLALSAAALRWDARADDSDSDSDALPILDTHQHLWDLSRFQLAWIKNDDKVLNRNFLPADYLKAVEGLNVRETIYMEVDVIPSQQVQEAEYAADLSERGEAKMAAAVISGRPNSDGFAAYLDRFRNNPRIKGIRQVLHGPSTPAGYALDPKFAAGIRELGKRGLSFDLCMRGTELLDGAKLIDQCPKTRFILDHCGNGDVQATPKNRDLWRKGMDEVAKRPNVVCKISGIVASAKRGAWSPDDLAPLVNHSLDAFGPNRVMFGGDWPVCLLGAESFGQWVKALREIVKNRPLEDRRKLFYENAVKFYGVAQK